MYRGFNLNKIDKKKFNQSYNTGLNIFNEDRKKVMGILKDYTLNEGVLNGTKMQSDWFPQINSHIFISHSHNDQEDVIALAGWLYDTFNLKSFIDSCVWGNANDLLKLIDDKYCLQSDGNYDYDKRNYSTSHVHMILSTALTKMIDKSECLIFYNTPKSISSASIIATTESPWIYSEILISQVLRHKVPSRLKVEDTRMFSKGGAINEHLRIEYELDLKHLNPIDEDFLQLWKKCKQSQGSNLDILYKLSPSQKTNIINK